MPGHGGLECGWSSQCLQIHNSPHNSIVLCIIHMIVTGQELPVRFGRTCLFSAGTKYWEAKNRNDIGSAVNVKNVTQNWCEKLQWKWIVSPAEKCKNHRKNYVKTHGLLFFENPKIRIPFFYRFNRQNNLVFRRKALQNKITTNEIEKNYI